MFKCKKKNISAWKIIEGCHPTIICFQYLVYVKKVVLGPSLKIFLAEIKKGKVFSSKVLEFLPAVFVCLETTAGIN